MKIIHKFLSIMISVFLIITSCVAIALAQDDVVNSIDGEDSAPQISSAEGPIQEYGEPLLIEGEENAEVSAILYSAENACRVSLKWSGSGDYKIYAKDISSGNRIDEKTVYQSNARKSSTPNKYEYSANIYGLTRGQCYELHIGDKTTIYFLATKVVVENTKNKQAMISWDGPSNNCTVHTYDENGTEVQASTSLSKTQATVSGLKNGAYYSFQLEYSTGGKKYNSLNSISVEIGVRPTIVGDLRIVAGYNSATLKWSSVKDATGYVIYRNDAEIARVDGSATSYKDSNTAERTTYTYKVYTVEDGVTSLQCAKVDGGCVRGITYTIKLGSSKTGTGTNGIKHTFPKGSYVTAIGYSGGNYKAEYGGGIYSINHTYVSSASANYTTSFDYSTETAVDVANMRNPSTEYFIWASYYTQHLYLLQKVNNIWTVIGDWNISSGKPTTPSPSGNFKTEKHYSTKHSIRYWTTFSTENAFHGCLNATYRANLGKPASGGCVRNLNENALKIYNLPLGVQTLQE